MKDANWIVVEWFSLLLTVALGSFGLGLLFATADYSFSFLIEANIALYVPIGFGVVMLAAWLRSLTRKIVSKTRT